ncbi:MAG: hypothetical protein LBH96_01520 [Candidatus Peribacteria bacterium]|jgi:GTP-binding protein|nr:hypothetical protein [Candidatus Peribacteria bacterium]
MEKTKWLDMTQEFLLKRKSLKTVFLLIDASIPPQKIDLEMIENFVVEEVNFALVFTKIDKGSQKNRSMYLKLFKQELQKITSTPPLLFFVANTS